MTGGLPARASGAQVPATESQGPQASGGSRGSRPWASTDVLIVGAGPAGLAAAVELRRLGAGTVVVVERDDEAGGIPRHSAHTGFGARDLRRVLTGPGYARRYTGAAAAAGADIRPGTTVTGWDGTPGGGLPGDGRYSVTLTSPAGIETVAAGAVLLATGCRERPRTARLVPGDRPPGVMTTGELQRRVYLAGQRLPGRALVVGAEHVSFSAMVTLAHAGAQVIALVTDRPRHTSYAAFGLAASWRWHVPVWPSTVVRRVAGRGRLEGVELADLRTGETRFVPCDLVVFTGDWIPDHELARAGGLAMDPGTRGPAVDTALADLGARRVRGRQPGARGGDGGHRRARRQARGARDRGVPAGRARAWISPGTRAPAGDRRAAAAVDRPERAARRGPGPAARAFRPAQRHLRQAGQDRGLAGRAAAGHGRFVWHATRQAGPARRFLDGPGRPRRRPGDRAAGLTRAHRGRRSRPPSSVYG